MPTAKKGGNAYAVNFIVLKIFILISEHLFILDNLHDFDIFFEYVVHA